MVPGPRALIWSDTFPQGTVLQIQWMYKCLWCLHIQYGNSINKSNWRWTEVVYGTASGPGPGLTVHPRTRCPSYRTQLLPPVRDQLPTNRNPLHLKTSVQHPWKRKTWISCFCNVALKQLNCMNSNDSLASWVFYSWLNVLVVSCFGQ